MYLSLVQALASVVTDLSVILQKHKQDMSLISTLHNRIMRVR